MLDLIFRSLAANRFVQKALFRLLNEENQRLLGDQSKHMSYMFDQKEALGMLRSRL